MISEEYRELNARMHREKPSYGTSGHKYLKDILIMLDTMDGVTSIIDYGCGKATLKPLLEEKGYVVHCYDPAVKKYGTLPPPSDFLVCTDVLEHVEPEYLDDVLGNMARLALKGAFMAVATRPAKKVLADGRNAHLIVEKDVWWQNRINQHFRPHPARASTIKDSIFYYKR